MSTHEVKVERGGAISPELEYLEAMRAWIKESDTAMAKVIADVCGHRLTYSYRYYDADEGPDLRHFPLDKLHLVVQRTGDTRLLDWIEAQVGRVAVALPAAGAAGGLHAGAVALRETAEAVDVWVKALEDGTLSDVERERVAIECREAMAALAAIVAACTKSE